MVTKLLTKQHKIKKHVTANNRTSRKHETTPQTRRNTRVNQRLWTDRRQAANIQHLTNELTILDLLVTTRQTLHELTDEARNTSRATLEHKFVQDKTSSIHNKNHKRVGTLQSM